MEKEEGRGEKGPLPGVISLIQQAGDPGYWIQPNGNR